MTGGGGAGGKQHFLGNFYMAHLAREGPTRYRAIGWPECQAQGLRL